jgi:hypothetical protein
MPQLFELPAGQEKISRNSRFVQSLNAYHALRTSIWVRSNQYRINNTKYGSGGTDAQRE